MGGGKGPTCVHAVLPRHLADYGEYRYRALSAANQTQVVGGLNTFNALLINEAFGFNVTDAQLLSIPIGVLIVITYQLIA